MHGPKSPCRSKLGTPNVLLFTCNGWRCLHSSRFVFANVMSSLHAYIFFFGLPRWACESISDRKTKWNCAMKICYCLPIRPPPGVQLGQLATVVWIVLKVKCLWRATLHLDLTLRSAFHIPLLCDIIRRSAQAVKRVRFCISCQRVLNSWTSSPALIERHGQTVP